MHCEPLSDPRHGKVISHGNQIGAVAVHVCNNNGTIVMGNKFRQCLEDLTWSGVAPTCNGEWITSVKL